MSDGTSDTNGNGNGDGHIEPDKKQRHSIIQSHPMGEELEKLIDEIIKPKKVGKSRFLAALLTNYSVAKRYNKR
jgi:hypothetical protein